MLQQGRFAADVLYFYGEDSNLTAIFANKAPDIPAGYGFDYINADALIHMLHVGNGQIATASGMSYRRAGAGSLQQAHVAASAARDPQAGGAGRGGRRGKADRHAEPGR